MKATTPPTAMVSPSAAERTTATHVAVERVEFVAIDAVSPVVDIGVPVGGRPGKSPEAEMPEATRSPSMNACADG
jgi:hypothetical protein